MTQGQGPLNDPRLVARRGDLSGLNAALFVLLVIAAFIAAGYLLATYLGIGASASPSPSGEQASPSPSPSRAPSPSASASPSPTPGSSTIPIVAIGQRADVIFNGVVIGTVSVISVDFPDTVGGRAAGVGQRWLITRIRYTAVDAMAYANTDWFVLDAAGERHPWAGTDVRPPLGAGTLKAGTRKAGLVTFRVPLTGELSLVMTRPDGTDRLLVPVQ